MAAQNPLNIIQHCRSCPHNCCHSDVVVATEQDYQRIIAAGFDDRFTKTSLPEGNFYVLDFRGRACAYLSRDHFCTVQHVKPSMCRIYPARLNEKDEIIFKDSCPASPLLDDTFKQAVRQLVLDTYYTHLPPALYTKAIIAYDKRRHGGMLEAILHPVQFLRRKEILR
jgi:Fe-S-cluster containining protein